MNRDERRHPLIQWALDHANMIDAILQGAIALAVIGVFASFAHLIYRLP